MPPAKRRTITHAAPLLDSLEQRLDLLTRTLSAASGRLPRASGKVANKNCTPSMPQQN